MTALAASKSMTALTPSRFNAYDVAAATTIYLGAMVVLNYLGQAVPAASLLQGHMRVVGVSAGRLPKGRWSGVDADDAVAVSAGDYRVQVEAGKFNFVNGATTDAITAADIGGWAYAMDDATVSRDSKEGNRPCVGEIKAITDDGLITVEITGQRWHSRVESFKADADLSALRNTIVRFDNASGVARAESATADTDSLMGVLINAPAAANAMALVVTNGPAPLLVGAGGITAGENASSTAGGAAIVAGAADAFVGRMMETGTSAQTKMVYVQPGRAAA
jgi:hypothetical protein